MEIIKIKTQLNLEVLNREIKIITQNDYLKAGDILKLCKDKLKDLDNERKTYTKPLDESKKLIMAKFNETTEPLQKYVDKISSEMDKFYRVEQAKIAEENKRLEAEAIKSAKKSDTDIIVPVVESIKTTRGSCSTTTMIERWSFSIVNPDEVERQLCSPDEKKLQGLVDAGIREIKGVRVFNTFKPMSR